MIVKTIDGIKGTERDVDFAEGRSIRPVLSKDGMGYSVHKTIIPAEEKGHWCYKNHLETCYCIEGLGILTDLTTGREYEITKDTVYMLNKHDDHTFEAITDVILISIFNPPCVGSEIHQKDGSYVAKG